MEKSETIAPISPLSNVTLHCASVRAELSRGVMSGLVAIAALGTETRREANSRVAMNLASIRAFSAATNLNVDFTAKMPAC